MANSNKEQEKQDKDLKANSKHHTMFEKIKDLLKSSTEKELKKLGYKLNDKVAGVYGDGTTYGAGVEEGKYTVKIISIPRKYDSSKNMSHGSNSISFEKQVFKGTKRVSTYIDIDVDGENVKIQYKSPESGFFRGVDENGNTFMINKRISIPLKDAANKLKKEIEEAASKEVEFLTATRLGVEDKLDASTTSIVESLDMKKLTLRNIFEGDLDFENKNINESFEKMPEDEKNIDSLIDKNTTKLDDDTLLLFDEVVEELKENEEFKKELEKFGTDKLSDLTPAEKKELFNSLKEEMLKEDGEAGLTMSGPSGAGAGAYLTPYFAKALKRKFSKSSDSKESKIGAPFTIPAGSVYESNVSLNESRKKSFESTPYAKSKQGKPKVDKDYNIIPEERFANASKPFTQVVNVDYNTHPQGMPFVKPNSKEELKNTVNGDSNKLKRMGINESETQKTERLSKRKFLTLNENEESGVNKRYIVTEKTSSEYEQERWKKLSLFDKFETIKEAEEMNDILDNIDEYNSFFTKTSEKELVSESYESNKSEEVEKTIEVEKPGSVFGITQKFYEKDFLNENKNYILDLNSMVFVKNPNSNI